MRSYFSWSQAHIVPVALGHSWDERVLLVPSIHICLLMFVDAFYTLSTPSTPMMLLAFRCLGKVTCEKSVARRVVIPPSFCWKLSTSEHQRPEAY
jgi:hypothetical protein